MRDVKVTREDHRDPHCDHSWLDITTPDDDVTKYACSKCAARGEASRPERVDPTDE